MVSDENKLTYKEIVIFWLPLIATLIMMMAEAPFLVAVIARLANAKYNLAAFGVAYALAMFFEAPVMLIMSASNALVRDKNAFLKLRNFIYILNAIVTLIMLFTLIPPVFRFLVENIIGLPKDVATVTYIACFILLPWPPAIGYRRFYQGILIRNKLPRRVTYGTIVRLSTMAATASLCYFFFELEGAYVGALALSLGVLMEALATRLMVGRIINRLIHHPTDVATENPLTYQYIINFYAPLALGTMLNLGIRPLVTLFIGKSLLAIESLAVFPVVYGLLGVLFAFGWSFQELNIALVGEKFENFQKIRNFAFILSIFSTGILLLIAFTPLADIWFRTISGLSAELTSLSITPTQIVSLIPLLHMIVCFQASFLVAARKTRPIIIGAAVEVAAVFGVLTIGIHYMNMVGVIAAVAALCMGKLANGVYLFLPSYRALKAKNPV